MQCKTGWVLAGFYLAIFIVCLVAALMAGFDPKSRFVLLQLPLAFQLAGLDALGVLKALPELDWVSVYLLIGLPTLVFLYAIGCGLGALVNRVIRFLRVAVAKSS